MGERHIRLRVHENMFQIWGKDDDDDNNDDPFSVVD